jgi:hypothetical protein
MFFIAPVAENLAPPLSPALRAAGCPLLGILFPNLKRLAMTKFMEKLKAALTIDRYFDHAYTPSGNTKAFTTCINRSMPTTATDRANDPFIPCVQLDEGGRISNI